METIKQKTGDLFFRLAVFLIVTLLIIVVINDCSKPRIPLEPEIVYNYETDTVYSDRGYEEKYLEAIKEVDRWKTAPPKTIIKWKEPDLSNIDLQKLPDSLLVIIGELRDSIRIADNYIKYLPKNPKLIDINLTKDTLGLNLLNIDGRVTSYIYPIYLERFNYKWLEGDLKYTSTTHKTTKVKENRFNNLFVNGGYEFRSKSPEVSLEYYINMGRFKLEANTGFPINNNNNIRADLKLGYRIIK